MVSSGLIARGMALAGARDGVGELLVLGTGSFERRGNVIGAVGRFGVEYRPALG